MVFVYNYNLSQRITISRERILRFHVIMSYFSPLILLIFRVKYLRLMRNIWVFKQYINYTRGRPYECIDKNRKSVSIVVASAKRDCAIVYHFVEWFHMQQNRGCILAIESRIGHCRISFAVCEVWMEYRKRMERSDSNEKSLKDI